MNAPRLALLLSIAICLPLLTGGCGLPLATTAASTAADGASYATTNKSTFDHFTSMVSKKDCAFWRVLRNQRVCRDREGDRDPYQVNYNEPFRDQSEGGGVQYGAPLRAAPDAPATSWDAAAYKPTPAPTAPSAQPVTAVADATPTLAPEPAIAAPPPTKAKKPKGDHSAAKNKKKVKKVKPSPDQAAAVP